MNSTCFPYGNNLFSSAGGKYLFLEAGKSVFVVIFS